MDAIEYLKAKKRMCETIECIVCPISNANNGFDFGCNRLVQQYPERAVNVVEKWAKENPAKTYASVFKERFPKCNIELVVDNYCLTDVFTDAECICSTSDCNTCWNREYTESEDNNEN